MAQAKGRCESCGAELPAYPEGSRPRGRPPKVCRACAQDGSPLRKMRFDRRRGRGVDLGPTRENAVKPEAEDYEGEFMVLSAEVPMPPKTPTARVSRKGRRGLSVHEMRLLRALRNAAP